MSRQLVFVHGRAQQDKDPDVLKREWIEALSLGMKRAGLALPVSESDIHLPYYGNTLFAMSEGAPDDQVADVIVRGDGPDSMEGTFARAVLEEIRKRQEIDPDQLRQVSDVADVAERGPLNWEWTQAILRAVDRFVPFGSGASIALFTRDVYQYLTNTNIGKKIDDGVSSALTSGAETVVVAHSLGTVIAYRVLRDRGLDRGWVVPRLVTVGSPLAVEKIKEELVARGGLRRPECVGGWFNAMDERDVVALYPLTPENFGIDPAQPSVENFTGVRNHTDNRHGISGYLDNPTVAAAIHSALTGP